MIVSSFDFESMLEDLKSAEENTVVILHAAAHNPTGDLQKQRDFNLTLIQSNIYLIFKKVQP